MKTSNKILIGLGAAVLIGMIIFMTIFRGFAGRVMRDQPAGTSITAGGIEATHTYDFTDFSTLELRGEWAVDIHRGSGYEVTITADEKAFDILTAECRGGALILGFKEGTRLQANIPRVEVTMPVLEGLNASGALDGAFSGFSGENLMIVVAGGASIRGRDGFWEDVVLTINGAADVDLSDMKTVNADVTLAGAGSIVLSMDGGALTGSLAGASSLVYSGRVSRLDVEKSGLANISHE